LANSGSLLHFGFHAVHFGPYHVRRQLDLAVEAVGQAAGHRHHVKFLGMLALGAAQVGGHDDLGLFFQGKIKGGQHRPDAGVVSNVAVAVQGHVEVNPDKQSFLFDVDFVNISYLNFLFFSHHLLPM